MEGEDELVSDSVRITTRFSTRIWVKIIVRLGLEFMVMLVQPTRAHTICHHHISALTHSQMTKSESYCSSLCNMVSVC